jgi:SAM-dependent methyltransferase
VRPTERFSDRVDDYVRYRPGYPPQALESLVGDCGLGPEATVADVGAGTGIWTGRLVDTGCQVLALEPNREMRRAGRQRLGETERVTWLDATAEATGLADASVDLVTAAQAFHWFDRQRARAELARILRPGGCMAVIWNERHKSSTPFLAAYERLLMAWAIDYQRIDHTRIGRADLEPFFAPARVREFRCDNRQRLDLEGLEGRLRSCSYAPGPEHPDHEPMLDELRRIFAACQENGRVTIDYDCRIYYGRLG